MKLEIRVDMDDIKQVVVEKIVKEFGVIVSPEDLKPQYEGGDFSAVAVFVGFSFTMPAKGIPKEVWSGPTVEELLAEDVKD